MELKSVDCEYIADLALIKTIPSVLLVESKKYRSMMKE
jgi:hypothetical protein